MKKINYGETVKSINSFLDTSPLNRIEEIGIERIWEYPLVGVAVAGDPLFQKLKDPSVIGEHHLTPGEWLEEARSVISYFLPFTEPIRKSNYGAGMPAQEWVYGRIEGEMFNDALRRHIVDVVTGSGFKAVAPLLDPRFGMTGDRSNWSERHAAFIAGLGTFSLGKNLITSRGCAGRYGSVVVSMELDPTPREYTEIDEYCNMCGECIDRCPSSAISEAGKDLSVCQTYISTNIIPRFAPRYGCGKCQTSVPCESRIP